MELKQVIRMAAAKKGLSGIMELTKACGITYPRTVKLWNGDTSGKLADLQIVCKTLDIKIKYEF